MAPTSLTAWIMGAVALSAFLLPLGAILVLALLVLVVAAVDAAAVRHAPTVERSTADVLSRGVPSPLEIVVDGPPDRIVVRQPATPDLRVEPAISDGGLAAMVTPVRRGAHSLPAPAVRLRGPLGLATWTHQVGEPHALQVFPDMPAARRIAARVRHGLFQLDGERIRGSLGLGTAFDSLREYVDGDDVRRVNWLATSRSTHPMVNQYRVEQDRDVICVIDCGRLMSAPLGDLTRMDAAVDAAAAIGAVADVVGDRVGVVAFEETVIRDLSPIRRGGEALARTIYDLEPAPRESDYRLAFERVAQKKRAFVLVLTDLLDAAAARPLVGAIPVLARHHSVAVASASDPDILAALTDATGEPAAAAKAVVAVDVLEGRRLATAALERHGAAVIDVDRARLNAACVAAYLMAKSRVRF